MYRLSPITHHLFHMSNTRAFLPAMPFKKCSWFDWANIPWDQIVMGLQLQMHWDKKQKLTKDSINVMCSQIETKMTHTPIMESEYVCAMA